MTTKAEQPPNHCPGQVVEAMTNPVIDLASGDLLSVKLPTHRSDGHAPCSEGMLTTVTKTRIRPWIDGEEPILTFSILKLVLSHWV
ncbi:hypothetical protein XM38_003710 [Halomicronema hongdechloris C2206]|uniref:Uncharacterized protein n=1 Tax=Halomicronema hongdechloris C2206 TaxID=1641165 RepID=A0A1Z3HGN4_9CYAN|nr:hypothetical protein XM38_003710 [Halomicronema hongdechloris C2206]